MKRQVRKGSEGNVKEEIGGKHGERGMSETVYEDGRQTGRARNGCVE